MTLLRITKKFNFEMAHALWNYDGLCKNIHGHSYKLWVTVKGCPVKNSNGAKQGMVIDFGILKEIVHNHIIDKFDHSLVVNKHIPQQHLKHIEQMYERLHIFDNQPTCENIVIEFVRILQKHLPPNIELFSLLLSETDTSFAEWYANDNKD